MTHIQICPRYCSNKHSVKGLQIFNRKWSHNCEHKVFLRSNQKSKRKVQVVPQLQTAAIPRHQEEEETDKTKQAQIEHTYENQ